MTSGRAKDSNREKHFCRAGALVCLVKKLQAGTFALQFNRRSSSPEASQED